LNKRYFIFEIKSISNLLNNLPPLLPMLLHNGLIIIGVFVGFDLLEEMEWEPGGDCDLEHVDEEVSVDHWDVDYVLENHYGGEVH